MANDNHLSLNIPDADLKAIRDLINNLMQKILPHLINLTPEEIKQKAKMGDKSTAFVTKAYEYCILNKELVPAYLDMEEFRKDIEAVEILRQIFQPIQQLHDAISDTMLLAGSEAYQAALMFYNTMKLAAKNNVPHANTIYSELSTRFPGRTAKKAAKKANS